MSCEIVSRGLPHKMSNNIHSQGGGEFLSLPRNERRGEKPSCSCQREAMYRRLAWKAAVLVDQQSSDGLVLCLTRGALRQFRQIYGEGKEPLKETEEKGGNGGGGEWKEAEGKEKRKKALKEGRKIWLDCLARLDFLSLFQLFLSTLLFLLPAFLFAPLLLLPPCVTSTSWGESRWDFPTAWQEQA